MGTRRTEICERLAARLRSGGAAAFAAHLDLADPRSIDRFVESADYLIGAVDVLVSAAGLSDGAWVGAQHLAAQVIPPMINNRQGDVVLIGPELLGASFPVAHRMLEAWVCGLDAEFIGTGVRASIIRATGTGGVAPQDIGCLIAGLLDSAQRTHMRIVDVIPPVPAPLLDRDRHQRGKFRETGCCRMSDRNRERC